MKKWEYEVKVVDFDTDMLKSKLDALGPEGWELVAVNLYRRKWALTLKRPAKE